MRYFILGASSIFTLVCLAIVTAFAPYLYPQTLLAERNVRSAYRRLHDVTNHAHSATTAINNVGGAKDIFLRNLERKQAGDEVSSSELDANIASLMAEVDRTGLPSPPGTTTLVGNLQSWRGRWRICHAPHIEALGKILLTSFPIVDYYFPSEDGRMLSNARYESAVFGSGWLNADGRIEKLGDDSSVAASSSVKENEQGGAGDTAVHRKGQVVKVTHKRVCRVSFPPENSRFRMSRLITRLQPPNYAID